MSGATYMFEEQPWPAIEERVRRCDIVILPLAAMNTWPAPLPVACDAFIVEGLVRQGAALAAEEVGALALPVFEYSAPPEPNLRADGPHLPWHVLLEFLVGILRDLHRQGFRRFVFVNAQGKTGAILARASGEDGEEGGPRMAGEGFSYQTAFGYAYDAAADFVENGPDVECFFVSIASFFRRASAVAHLPWWQASGEGDLPLAARCALLRYFRPDLWPDDSPVIAPTWLGAPYDFLSNPRYGMGAVMRESRFQPQAGEASGDIEPQLGEQLVAIWAEKFAAMLREMQAKAAQVGRYRADAYRSGQP